MPALKGAGSLLVPRIMKTSEGADLYLTKHHTYKTVFPISVRDSDTL